MMPSDHHNLLAGEIDIARQALCGGKTVTPRLHVLRHGHSVGVIEFTWPPSMDERWQFLDVLRGKLRERNATAYALSGEVRGPEFEGLFAFVVDGETSMYVDQEICERAPVAFGTEEWAGADWIAEEFRDLLARAVDTRTDDVAAPENAAKLEATA